MQLAMQQLVTKIVQDEKQNAENGHQNGRDRDVESRDRDETETSAFETETRPETLSPETETRPRRWQIVPRRDRDETLGRARDVSRPRRPRPRAQPC